MHYLKTFNLIFAVLEMLCWRSRNYAKTARSVRADAWNSFIRSLIPSFDLDDVVRLTSDDVFH